MRRRSFFESSLLVAAASLAAACVSTPDAPDVWRATVPVTSAPSGAQVVWFQPRTLDPPGGGPTEVGTTPFEWEVSTALIGAVESVTLVAYKPGHGRTQLDVPVETLRSGGPIALEIPEFATLEVVSDPIATFDLIDEQGTPVVAGEYAPQTVAELTPGTYTLRSTRDGYAPHEEHVQLRAGERVAVRIELALVPGPPDGEPRMSIRPGAVEGVDAEPLYAGVVLQARNVAGCYDRALARDPAASGEVEVTLTLNLGFGTVDGAEITRSDIRDADTLECIQRRLRRVTFRSAATEGAGTASVTLNFHRIPRP